MTTDEILHFLQVEQEPPSLTFLDALVAAYTWRVPWESAFRIAKRAITAETVACPRWPGEFWRDAQARGGGGTCFESNYRDGSGRATARFSQFGGVACIFARIGWKPDAKPSILVGV